MTSQVAGGTAVLTLNRACHRPAEPPLPPRATTGAAADIVAWDGYAPTTVRQLPGLADALDVAEVAVKLEGERFGVGSFKALGPPYALQRVLHHYGALSAADDWTAIAPSTGNHGRALAWGAHRLGAQCIVVLPAHVSPARAAAIAAFGAVIRRVEGDFDAACATAAALAEAPRHLLITDRGSEAIGRDLLAGYSVIAAELIAQWVDAPPTHVFVPAGQGLLAAALAMGLRAAPVAPRIVAVEPLASDALRRSLAQGRRVSLPPLTREWGPPMTREPGVGSIMDGLVTASPSSFAWPLLSDGIDAALAISDADAVAALHYAWSDGLAIGETGIAGLAGLRTAAARPDLASALGIGPASRLLAIATEDIADPELVDCLIAGGMPVEWSAVPSASAGRRIHSPTRG